MADERTYGEQGVALGLVLGAGVGTTGAVLAGFDLALGAAYGTGGGIVLGALVGRLLDGRAAAGRRPLAWLFGPAVGGAVGGATGTLGAWSVDAPAGDGVLVGAAIGFAAGLLMGGVLHANGDAEEDGSRPA